jgi:hypothetical protein
MGSYLIFTIWQLKTYYIHLLLFCKVKFPNSADQSMCFIVVHSPRALSPREPELSFVQRCRGTNIKSSVSKLGPGSARLGKTRVSKLGPSNARSG